MRYLSRTFPPRVDKQLKLNSYGLRRLIRRDAAPDEVLSHLGLIIVTSSADVLKELPGPLPMCSDSLDILLISLVCRRIFRMEYGFTFYLSLHEKNICLFQFRKLTTITT